MREIRFRFWDSINKQMTQVYDLFVVENVYQEGKDFYKYDVMQYTGLKDKDGKEIYEGDLIKTNLGIMQHSMQLVEFVRGSFVFSNGDVFQVYNPSQIYEVMGNIYENPELIEKRT